MRSIMKKTVAALLLGSTVLVADVNVVVSNVVQKLFVEKIGGDKVAAESMVPVGSNPHAYTPKPAQMKMIEKADIYFTIGIEFENAWLPKFKAQNDALRVVSMREGVTLRHFEEGHDEHEHHEEGHHEEEDHEEHAHKHEGIDPHVWMSPEAVKTMAGNIYQALREADPKNAAQFEKNHQAFVADIDAADQKIRTILKNVQSGTKFMVFHPGFGYFARQYGLTQVAIEVEGKEPKPKTLAHLVEEAKEEGIKTIITSPAFSDKAAKTLAKEIGASVIKISPLDTQWPNNLIYLAETIAHDNRAQDSE